MVISIKNFVYVECLVFLHLLFHQVLHDSGVEVLAGLLVRDMVLFWVIKQRFTILILFERCLFVMGSQGTPNIVLACILRVALSCVARFFHAWVIANGRVVLLRARLSVWTCNGNLVNKNHLC